MGRPTALQRDQREAFQTLLDDLFPLGAMCVTLGAGERLAESGDPLATGRLICTGATHEGSQWWYQLIIDPRRTLGEDTEALSVWVTKLKQLQDAPGLWEADVKCEPGRRQVLRLNGSPPERWRPTNQMRRAVSQAYAGV